MKRCPQCEFIYEDDQSLCDMDGVLLVFDSRALPNLHAFTTVPAKAQAKRNRAVPVFASLTLALVLGMVYYVSTSRKASQSTYTPPPPSAASVVIPAPPVENPTPEAKAVEIAKPAEPAEEPKSTPKAVSAPAAKKSTKATPVVKPVEAKKEDSKVNSILKKTGRILKKPFKF